MALSWLLLLCTVQVCNASSIAFQKRELLSGPGIGYAFICDASFSDGLISVRRTALWLAQLWVALHWGAS